MEKGVLAPLALAVRKLVLAGYGLFQHSLNVAAVCSAALDLRPDFADGFGSAEVVAAALLHDLGKALWPREYFELPVYLLANHDLSLMRAHPMSGANEARVLGMPGSVVKLVALHHERPGGRGYPVREQNPPAAAMLIGGCDAFCACLESRIYRPSPLSFEKAREEAVRQVGEEIASVVAEAAVRAGIASE